VQQSAPDETAGIFLSLSLSLSLSSFFFVTMPRGSPDGFIKGFASRVELDHQIAKAR